MYSDPSIAKVQEDETLGGCGAVTTPVVVFFRRASSSTTGDPTVPENFIFETDFSDIFNPALKAGTLSCLVQLDYVCSDNICITGGRGVRGRGRNFFSSS